VTGVVGPNGSGKSNIVDAIRWVLGEQKTTELRLSSMSDVLFNGTKKRKKSGLAQVTLEFDNTRNLIPSEYTQVSVSRLLFRNGESEYRINDVPCRLMDIRSLFVDTGIGSDSYAIIALNMVDDILTDSDGSRRRMFEQASGISKYKKRKKETINKLAITNADLDRVEDLLFEIGNNLQDLEKQARRVKRFLAIKDQYKEISVQLQLLRYDEIKSHTAGIQKQVQEESDRHRKLETELRTVEAELQKRKQEIIANEQELSSFQREINSMLDEVRKLESEKQLLNQQRDFDLQKKKNLLVSQTELKELLVKLEEDLTLIQIKANEERARQDHMDKAYRDIEDHYEGIRQNYQEIKADHDEHSRRKRILEDDRFKLEKQIAVDENQLNSLQALSQRKMDKINQLNEEIQRTSKHQQEHKEKIGLLGKELDMWKADAESRKVGISTLVAERDEVRIEKEKLSRALDARSNEYELVKSMIDSLEGFPESIRYLHRKWKVNAPLLTDLIYAPEDFKLAIESFLDPYLNFFVVDDKEDVFEAIALLNGAQKGKANFFILDRIPEEIETTQILNGLIPAVDCLEYDEKYLKLISRLLKNVYITELDVEDAQSLLMEMGGGQCHVLDKKGTFITSGFSISGGSVGLFEGKKLGRKKNLEKLEDEIRKYRAQTEQLDARLIRIQKDISVLEQENDNTTSVQLEKQLESAKIRLLEVEFGISNLHAQKNTLQSEITQHQKEIDRLGDLMAEMLLEKASLQSKLSDLSPGHTPAGTDLQTITDRLSRAAESRNASHIELIRQQNIVENLQSELKYKEADLERAQNQFQSNEQHLLEIDSQKLVIEDKLEGLESTLIRLYEQKSNKEKSLSDVEKAFYAKRAAITDLEERISGVRRNLQQSQFLINELKDKLHDQDYRMQSIRDRLQIEFNLVLDELIGWSRSEMALPELEEKHDRLRRQIENFGEVNTMAVEAYDEMKERFDTITKQKDDIISARESLMETIDEIERVATEKYLDTFGVVNRYFKQVFTRLFNEGDDCDIIMEDTEQPLESKIEIIAKPKGKRPRTLSQLSGGEKTLTAIALLFSLYLYKPAPFCIFDEVDAPLDDANIEKFNKIIREFSHDSQFIIITHNKATMAAVDVLYGVFMQEMGVSEVAAVDFRNYEHLHTIASEN